MTNPLDTIDVDAVLEQNRQEKQDQSIFRSVRDAVGQNPDRRAKALSFQPHTNLPSGVIERNLEEIQKKHQLDSINVDAILREAPKARKFLENPDNAVLTSDDMGMFARLSRYFGEGLEAFPQGQDRTRLFQLRSAEIFRDMTPEEQAEIAALSESLQDSIDYASGTNLRTAIVGPFAEAPQTFEQLKGAAVGAVGAGLTALGVGALIPIPEEILTLPGALTVGGRAGQAYQNFIIQSGAVRDDLIGVENEIGERLDPHVVNGAAVLAGAVNAGLDIAPFEKFLKTVPGVEKLGASIFTKQGIREAVKLPGVQAALYRVGKRLSEAGLYEAGTEALQEFVNITAEEASKKLSDGDFEPITFSDAAGQIVEAGRVGGLVGTGMATPGSVASIPFEVRKAGKFSPDEVQAHVEGLHEEVRGNKLYQRSPDAFHSLIDSLTEDQKFYVSGEQLLAVVNQMPDEQRAELFAKAPDLLTELETASLSGADVAIKKSDYAAFIAPLDTASQLTEHVKLDPADLSVAERAAYQAFVQSNPELVQQVQQFGAEQLPPAAQEMTASVERIVRKALQEGGRSAVEARAVAPLFARTLSRFSAPFGQNAADNLSRGLLAFETVTDEGDTLARGSNIAQMIDDYELLKEGKKVRGLDPAGEQALRAFGERMEAGGVTPEAARAMTFQELSEKIQDSKVQNQPVSDIGSVPQISAEEVIRYLYAAQESIPDEFRGVIDYVRGLIEQSGMTPEQVVEGGTDIINQYLEQIYPQAAPIIDTVRTLYQDRAIESAVQEINSRPETINDPNFNSPERQALRENIANQLYGEGAINKDRVVDIILGPPASGKSTLANPTLERRGAILIDSDEAKKLLPEYDNGMGANAVHRESKLIIDGVLERAIAAGDNIVHPIVGHDPGKVQKLIDNFKEIGYSVHVSLVSTDTETSLQRNQQRFFATGRLVPPDYIMAVGDKPIRAFQQLKQHEGVETYVHIDTTAGRAELVETNDNEAQDLYGESPGRGTGLGEDQGGGRLAQKERGSITFTADTLPDDFQGRLREVVIQFTSKANASTAIHEFSHWGVATHRMFADMARQRIIEGDKNPEMQRILRDWEALKKRVGAESDVFTVNQEEEVARLFEAYMREGKAPSEGLRRVFARFRDWLMRIYRDLADLGVEMDDTVRGIFDRWLASEQEIAKVRGKNEAMEEIARNLGLADHVTSQVADYVNSALLTAEEKIFKELDREQKRRETKAYQQELEAMKAVVAEEFKEKREYSLIQYMRENGFKLLEGPETEGITEDILSDNADSENTILPDDIADLYGYDSGLSMVRALRKTPDFDGAVDREARKRLLTKYPDMIRSGRIQVEAVDAILNDRVLLALDLMVKELGKQFGGSQRASMKQFAKVMAKAQVEKMKMGEVNYAFRYEVARDQQMRQALIASRRGQPKEALVHLQRAMVNQTVYKSLEEFKDTRDKAQDLFRRVDQKDKKLATSRDMEVVEAARHLLWKFGLGGQEHNMAQWMEDVEVRNPDLLEDLAPFLNVVAEPGKDPKDLTTAEFLDIFQAVKNLFSVARRTKELEREGRKIKIEKMVGEMIALMEPDKRPLMKNTQVVGWDRARQIISTVKASLRRVELWAKAMDRGDDGPFRRYLWDGISDAEDNYHKARREWIQGYRNILKKYEPRLRQRKKIESGMNKTGSFGRKVQLVWNDPLEMIGFLLHTGNESNLDKLLGGYGIEPEVYRTAIRNLEETGDLTKQDWDLVQELWDYVEKLKPLMQRAHKDLYGYRAEMIDPAPIESKHGVYRGGYWPAIADSDQTENTKTVEQQIENTRQYMLATTPRGFMKKRVQGYREPLMTDLRLGSQHIDKVLRMIYLEPAARNMRYIVRNRDFKAALKAVDPDALEGMIMPFLQRFVDQTTEEKPRLGDRSDRLERKIVRAARSSATSQLIRYNPSTAIQNVANLSVAVKLVGKRNFARALATVTMNPIAAHRRITEASTMLKNRFTTNSIKAMNEIEEMLTRKGSVTKMRNFLVRNGWVMMMAIDSLVSSVTWTAAYNKYATENPDAAESAVIRYADARTREVIGGMGSKDQSKFEAGHPLISAFIAPFMGYFNSQANLLGTEFSNIMREHGWRGSHKMFYTFMLMAVVPAVFAAILRDMLRDNLPDDDDDDGEILDDWLAYSSGETAKYMGAMIPAVGPVVTAAVNKFNENPMDDRVSMSPVVGFMDTTVRTSGSLIRAAQGEDVDDSRLIRDFMSTLGFLSGYPLGQFGKPVSYVTDIAEGDSRPESVVEFSRGLLGGPTPKGRK